MLSRNFDAYLVWALNGILGVRSLRANGHPRLQWEVAIARHRDVCEVDARVEVDGARRAPRVQLAHRDHRLAAVDGEGELTAARRRREVEPHAHLIRARVRARIRVRVRVRVRPRSEVEPHARLVARAEARHAADALAAEARSIDPTVGAQPAERPLAV
eukprot:scaffold29995_cov71-Phaeocystis_antarctica.AAC.4